MDSLLIPLLTTVGYALPELIASSVVLAMLWSSAKPGGPRSLGLLGAGLIFACTLIQLGLGLYQAWVLHAANNGGSVQIAQFFAWFSALRLLVNCISLVGLGLIAWALCKATRVQAPAPV